MDGKPFSHESEINQIKRLADRIYSRLVIIHCKAPIEVVKKRLENDFEKNKKKIRIVNAPEKMIKNFNKINLPHIVLNMNNPINNIVENCLKKIKNFVIT